MKYFVITISLLCSVLLEAQTRLDGEFCRNDGRDWFESDCIKLNLDGTFEYEMWHCTGTNKGTGIYTINNGKLNLNFKNQDSLTDLNREIEIKQYADEENREASLKLTLYDLMDSTKIQFANVLLFDSLKADTSIRGTSTDSLGKAYLKTANANLLRIDFVFYETIEIPVQSNKNIELMVGLVQKERVYYFSEEDQMTFPIKRIKSDKFLLKRYEEMDYLNYEVIKE